MDFLYKQEEKNHTK